MLAQLIRFSVMALLGMVMAEPSFATKQGTVPAELKETLQVYKESKGMVLDVNKTIKNIMLDKETNYPGVIQLAEGKFNWETTGPEKNLLVFDGHYLWNIQYPPAEFKSAQLQVAKMSMKAKNSPLIILEIFGKNSIDKYFTVSVKNQEGDTSAFTLKEKKTDLGLKDITLKINTKEHRVVSLEYKDEVDNQTIIAFKATQLDAKLKHDLFSYTPPKEAQVTEY